MRRKKVCRFLIALFPVLFIIPSMVCAEPLKFTSSTQFLWGDDLLGESQSIIAQYLRFSVNPDEKTYKMTGYGRVWKDFSDGGLRDDDLLGRLYYLYMDYLPSEKVSFRLGRQFVRFTASGSSIIDGLSIDVDKVGPLNITFSGGRDVVFTLDSERSKSGNYFAGININTEAIKSTQLGFSYIRKYDLSDLARERFGMNVRYFNSYLSPYAELRYDRLSESLDEAVVGIDFFPMNNVTVKGEFYHSYPIFDSTSIYSVFAVDKFREYLMMLEYSFDAPASVYFTYAKQTYDDSDNADRFTVGARYVPTKNFSVNASVDYRKGYGGNIWGFEVYCDYKPKKNIRLSAGVQHDKYRRTEFEDENYDYAQSYWLGGEWIIDKNFTLNLRLEENINENFEHRPLGRIALIWNL